MVKDGPFRLKIDYFTTFEEILNLEWHPNRITGSKSYGDFAKWVDFAY